MAEREVAFVKVQPRRAGNFMVTIPKDVSQLLSIKGGMKLKVLVDDQKRRVIYQL